MDRWGGGDKGEHFNDKLMSGIALSAQQSVKNYKSMCHFIKVIRAMGFKRLN